MVDRTTRCSGVVAVFRDGSFRCTLENCAARDVDNPLEIVSRHHAFVARFHDARAEGTEEGRVAL